MGSALLAQQNFLYALEIERIKALGIEQRLLNRVKELEKKLLNRKAAGPASQPACPSLRRKFFKTDPEFVTEKTRTQITCRSVGRTLGRSLRLSQQNLDFQLTLKFNAQSLYS